MMFEGRELLKAAGVRSERGLEELCDEMAAEGTIQCYAARDNADGSDGIRLYYSNASGEPSIPWDERMRKIYAALAVERIVTVIWVEFDNGVFPVIQFSEKSVHLI